MAILLRQNVNLNGVCPEILEAMRLLEKEQKRYGVGDLTVLSVNDSKHGLATKHNPTGQAMDFECILGKQEIMNVIKHLGFHSKDLIKYDWGWHLEFDNPFVSVYTIMEKLVNVEKKLDLLLSKFNHIADSMSDN